MQLMPHGGWCCGVKHLRSFGDPGETAALYTQIARRGKRLELKKTQSRYVDDPEKDFVDWKTESSGKTHEQIFDESVKGLHEGSGGIIEVILTDKFFANHTSGKFWAKKLKDTGFKLVSRFTNTNSGNVCNVFHLYKKPPVEGNPPNWE